MGFSISKYINIPVFITSLALGIFYVYIVNDDKKVIYVYPRPDNIDVIQYKDITGACYRAEQKKINCPQNPTLIPAQTL
jgi:hypothetical protein